MLSISVFQIYFDEKSQQKLTGGFIPIFNSEEEGYFENKVIKEIYEKNINTDYIGVTSWKMNSKTDLTGKDILNFIHADVKNMQERDVYLYPYISDVKLADGTPPEGFSMNGYIKAPDIWTQHRNNSPPAYELDKIINKSGVLPFDLFDGKWIYCHCNYWIAKKEIFNKYCETVLLPVIDFLESASGKRQTSHLTFLHPHCNKKYPIYSYTMEGLFGAFLAHSVYSYSFIHTKKSSKFFHFDKINILRYERIAC